MVGVFVRLKLRVLRNSLRGRTAVGMAAGAVIGLCVAAVTIVLGAAPFDRPGASVDLLAGAYATWLVGWIIAPIVTGGGDETLRPEHFTLLPIGRVRLATGLFAAGLCTVPAVVTLAAFCGLVVYGARFGPAPAVLGALFAVAGLALVTLLYRVVMAALAGLLGSRRGKDIAFVFVALAAFSGVAVNYVSATLGPALADGRESGLARVLRVLPTGWGPVAIRDAADGRWGPAVGLLAAALALVAVLVVVWGVLLHRRGTVTPYRGEAKSKPDGGPLATLSPSGPVGAVVVKELRTWWRDSRRRLALASSVIVGVVIIVAPAFTGGDDADSALRELPFLGPFFVAFAGMQAGNLYGFDGGALWHTIVAPRAFRPDVRGRQLAWALIVGPVGLALAAVLPGAVGRASAYPWVFALVPALVGAGSGIVVLQSVYVPYPLPDPRFNSNPFAAGGRPGFARMVLILGFFVLLAATVLPAAGVALAGTLTGSAVLLWLAVPVGVGTGAVLAWWWGGLAVTRLTERAPELLAVVSKER